MGTNIYNQLTSSRMAKKTRRGGKNKVSTHNAPSMQGMQQVNTWDLIDIVPITQGSGVAGIPYLV